MKDQPQQRAEVRASVRRDSYVLAGAVCATIVVAVYAYGNVAGPWVDTLDDRIGEIVAQRATGLASAGQTDQAIALYEEALALGFEAQDQYVWVRMRYGTFLVDTGRYDRAVTVAEEVFASTTPDIGVRVGRDLFARIHKALSADGHVAQALDAAQRMYNAGLRSGDRTTQGQALLLKGVSLLRLARVPEAREAFAAAGDADPTPEMKKVVEWRLSTTAAQ